MGEEKLIKQLTECLQYVLSWIDSIPTGTRSIIMPGFDRDYVDFVLGRATKLNEGKKEVLAKIHDKKQVELLQDALDNITTL